MFGFRADGYLIKDIDPIVALTPYIMPMRCDAQVMMDFELDFEKLARYIVDQGNLGHKVTFMDILIASYVRTVAELPELNRFIVNKRTYTRKYLTVSFTILKDSKDGKIEENAVKCYFDPRDNIYDVCDRVKDQITEGRKEDASNNTMQVAKIFVRPVLVNTLLGLVRLLDRYGLLPKELIDASPFHTSMFLTNMASIGMPAVKHHIYNFGTTSMFWSIGTPRRTVTAGVDGKAKRRRVLPIGVVADERIAAGRVYAMMCAKMMQYLNEPSLLEAPCNVVKYDEGHVYGLPKPKRHFWSRQKGVETVEEKQEENQTASM